MFGCAVLDRASTAACLICGKCIVGFGGFAFMKKLYLAYHFIAEYRCIGERDGVWAVYHVFGLYDPGDLAWKLCIGVCV